MSNRRYLKLVLPRLATRIFIESMHHKGTEGTKERKAVDQWPGYCSLCSLCLCGDSFLPSQERIQDGLFRPRNHVGANQLAVGTGGLSTRIDRCTDGADVAPDKRCHIGAANLNLTGQRDVRRLAHGIGR